MLYPKNLQDHYQVVLVGQKLILSIKKKKIIIIEKKEILHLHTTFASHKPRNCFSLPLNNKLTSPITAFISVRTKKNKQIIF
jgi:hypothetical protein